MTDTDTPTAATEAAYALAMTASAPGNPTARLLPGENAHELDAWELLTRKHLPDELRRQLDRSRELARRRDGIRPELPPVVVTLPATYLAGRGWSPMNGDPPAKVLADDGYPGWAFRLGVPVQPAGRVRWAFVGMPETLTPSPRASHELAVATIGARRAAERVDTWADSLPERAAAKARTEAAGYREYADRCEAELGRSFAWLDVMPEPKPAFPTIPATPWGFAHDGTT